LVRARRSGGNELTDPGDRLLRLLLEAAIEVARQGEAADPSVRAPTALRPYLRFRKLTPKALSSARAVLAVDDAFRERVIAGVTEERVGSASWRWLTRPPGWEPEWQGLVAELADADEAAQEASGVRRLEREPSGSPPSGQRRCDR
jgi:hypothetical protein